MSSSSLDAEVPDATRLATPVAPPARILDVVSGPSTQPSPRERGEGADAARLEAILEADHRQWIAFQFDRLRQFGYGFSMY